ncbi:helix-turn-helix domain-containing protein, partial [Timonella senegalensis]
MENKSAAGTGPDRRQSKRGRALSPSRLLILETLEAQAVPLTIAALTQRVGLHENTVRGHLDALLSDGFITRSPAEPDGRGRPSWLWQASTPSPQSAGALEYAGLAGALARTIALTAPDPVAA